MYLIIKDYKLAMMVIFLVVVLMLCFCLYLLDKHDIPSKIRVKSKKRAKRLSLAFRPIRITDAKFFAAIKASYLPVGEFAKRDHWQLYRNTAQKDGARNFLVGYQGKNKLIASLKSDEPGVAAAIVSEANRLAAGVFEPFGTQPKKLGRDFVWTNYPSRDDDRIFILEINTLQHLVILAQAYLLTKDDKFINTIQYHISSWKEENPIDNSVNWLFAMEVSIRLCSLIWVEKMLLYERSFDKLFPALIKLIFAHFQHLTKYIDNPRKTNNHGIFSAVGLFFFATNYPEFTESAKWKTFSEQRMIEELDLQYTRSGVHKELAPAYHLALLDIYLHYLSVKHILDEPIEAIVKDKIKRQLKFLQFMTSPNGKVFLIGDSDGHHFIRYADTNNADASPILQLGALLYGDNLFAADTPQSRWKCKWLLGLDRFRELYFRMTNLNMAAQTEYPAEITLYKDEGYFRLDSNDMILVGDFASNGMEENFSGHNHSDVTSFLLWKDKEAITLDGGTYTYRRSHKTDGVIWRDHFRSSYAHNTAVIDGRSHAVAGKGDFGYINYPTAEFLFVGSAKKFNVVAGRHFSYKETAGSAIRLFIAYDSYIAVIDWFPDINQEHSLDLNFLLNSDMIDIDFEKASFCRGSILWPAEPHVELLSFVGSTNPVRGWFSNAYGMRQATTHLQLRTKLNFHTSTAVLIDLSLSCSRTEVLTPQVKYERDGNLAQYRFTTKRGELTVLLSHNKRRNEFAGDRGKNDTDAEIAIVETGGLQRAFVFNGTFVRIDGKSYPPLPLLLSRPLSHVHQRHS